MKKINNKSITQNPTNLQNGDVQNSIEDRSAYFRSDDQVSWTGTQLEFSADIIFEILNTESGTTSTHTVDAGDSPITMADGESIYLEIDRTLSSETISFIKSTATAIPAQSSAKNNVIVFARRKDASSEAFLHLPFHKQMLNPGQTTRLGAGGTGGEAVKADLMDATNAALPTGTSVVVDGITGVDGDQVLFTNLASNNNRVYELSGVGVSLVWTAVRSFSGAFDPTDGDSVRIQRGTAFSEQLAVFNGTNFEVNNKRKMFDGVSVEFYEEEYHDNVALSGSQTNTVIAAFTFAHADFEGLDIEYKLRESTSNDVRIATLRIVTNGTSISYSETGNETASTGITLDAIINGANVEVRYSSGTNGGGLMAVTKKYRT